MSILLKHQSIDGIWKNIRTNKLLKKIWDEMYCQAIKDSKSQYLSQKADIVFWWHLLWDRLGNAAFVYAMTEDETIKKFVHDAVIEVCNKDIREWGKPWFSPKCDIPVDYLETTHIGVAISVAYDFCRGIFTDEEKKLILKSLRNKCQVLCEHYLDEVKKIHNWSMVMLNGYIHCSCILDDRNAAIKGVRIFKELLKEFNSNSYGESLQYSNYAMLNLCHAYEFLRGYDQFLVKDIDCDVYGNLMKWYASSLMYFKKLGNEYGDTVYPRSINFGDSAATFRPSGDLLIHISARSKNPQNAGLAQWLFNECYSKSDILPSTGYTFGLINDAQYLSFILAGDISSPVSPVDIGMPELNIFDVGSIILRDNWSDTKFIMGIQGGYKENFITGHRHLDQNSFVVSYMNERFLIDPGHCSYRLQSYNYSKSAISHSTWTFEDQAGNIITQTQIDGNYFTGLQEPLNGLAVSEKKGGLFVISSDIANAYGKNFVRAERTWIYNKSNVMFVVDKIKTKIPVKINTRFVINNRDAKTKINVVKNKRVVVRRNDVAMKLLPLSATEVSLTREWGYAHNYYDVRPNGTGQGKEGSALILNYTTDEYVTEYVYVYAFIFSEEPEVIYWHSGREDDNFYITDAEDVCKLSININKNSEITIEPI